MSAVDPDGGRRPGERQASVSRQVTAGKEEEIRQEKGSQRSPCCESLRQAVSLEGCHGTGFSGMEQCFRKKGNGGRKLERKCGCVLVNNAH